MCRSHGFLVTFVFLTLAACGGSSSSSGASTSSSPATQGSSASSGAGAKTACVLITKGEVDSVMGRPMEEGKLSTGGSSAERCTYFASGGELASLTVGLYRGPSVDAAKQAYQLTGTDSAHPTAGLGDEAKVGTKPSQSTGTIALRKGSLELDVTVAGSNPPPTEDLLKELAGKALQRS